jgi:NitT/TauT family transport system substrate-binding protein
MNMGNLEGVLLLKTHRYYGAPLLALLLIFSMLAAACGGTPTTDTADESEAEVTDAGEASVIRVGYLPVITYTPLYLGIERGYYAAEGIEFELSTIRSGNDAIIQLGAGNFDVAMGGANAGLFNAVNRGLEFRIVAPMHGEEPPVATPLVISANRTDEFQEVADLEGKRVAVHAFGAGIEYWVQQALAQGGLTMDDVELKEVLFPDMPAALENGAIDAAVLTEPLATIGIENGLLAILSEDYIDGFFPTYAYMNNDWLTENPDLAHKFMRGYIRACRDLQGDYMNEEIAEAIEKYTEIPVDVTMQSATPIFDPDGEIPLEDLETLQRFYQEREQLQYDELLDVSTFVNTELAAEVARELDEEEE